MPVGRLPALVLLVAGSIVPRPAAAPGLPPISFARDVRPVLARACFDCHGSDKQRAGLRLDSLAALSDVVVHGQAEESPLWRRLVGADGDERMPLDAPALANEEIARVRRWIDGGAVEVPRVPARHWAYRPPERPPLPPVRAAEQGTNPIDRFVFAALEKNGVQPAPPASPQTLIRRAYLDLTGLPPNTAAVDAFLADTRPDAYARLVDQLLSSPAYGERWAVTWLDAIHYADSNGYEKDRRREAWLFRDWVVNALNDDLPFDQFVVRQLAGDKLPGASVADRIATGYLRTPQTNEEGGVDAEEARWEAVVDRVGTMGSVLLGTTLACAQCHDHKHDPISQRDFYRLLAFFDEAREGELEQPNAQQALALAQIEPQRERLRLETRTWTPALAKAQTAWEESVRNEVQRWTILQPLQLTSTARTSLQTQADGVIAVGAPAGDSDEHVIEAQVDREQITGLRIESLPDPQLPGGGPGRGSGGSFFLGGVTLEAAPRAPSAAYTTVDLARSFSDEPTLSEPHRYAVDNLVAKGSFEQALGPADGRGWGVSPPSAEPPRARQAVLLPRAAFGFPHGTRLRVRLRYPAYTGADVIGKFRLSVTTVADPETAVALTARLRTVVHQPAAARSKRDSDELAQAFRDLTPLLAAARAEHQRLTQQRTALGVATTLVATSTPSTAVPTALVRVRGSYTQPGARVTAGLPVAFTSLDKARPAPRDRLELARWLVGRENPLTARVLVNRLWAHHFGRGLVETVDDFGVQGAPPSHPALLDWLAAEFMEKGWSQKAIHRLIVNSATYKQASEGSSDVFGTRGPRFRLDAEVLRDQALLLSGLLDLRRGGPPVFPARGDGDERLPNSDEVVWPSKGAGDENRRSLYTFVRRTRPFPLAALFDAPSRETCSLRRDRSNTPMQALSTLNAPVFWQAARGLAARMLATSATIEQAIAFGFREATGTVVSQEQAGRLADLYRRQLGRLNQNKTLTPPARQTEAMALVANVILNLDETLTQH